MNEGGQRQETFTANFLSSSIVGVVLISSSADLVSFEAVVITVKAGFRCVHSDSSDTSSQNCNINKIILMPICGKI